MARLLTAADRSERPPISCFPTTPPAENGGQGPRRRQPDGRVETASCVEPLPLVPGPPLPPNRNALLGPGHSLFVTNLGPLDALGAIEGGADYDQLAPVSRTITIAGRSLRVLPLDTIVALKRTSTDPKDKLRLPVLEAALRRQNRDS